MVTGRRAPGFSPRPQTSTSAGPSPGARRWPHSAPLQLVAGFVLLLPVVVLVQILGGGYGSDLHWPDEASHFLNGLLIHDYIVDGLPGNPIAYAVQYYVHWPKIAIGHWPPLFYGVEAGWFLIAGPSVASALWLQAVVAAALAAVVGCVVGRLGGWIAGIPAALATIAAPQIVYGVQGVMVDIPLALLDLLAVLAWARLMVTPAWSWSWLFALAASAAILTKSNGLCLALFPALAIILARRFDLLRDLRVWLPAPVVAIATLPWYLATYRMATSSFEAGAGSTFILGTAPTVAAYLPRLIGVLGLILAALGAAHLLMRPRRDWPTTMGLCMVGFVIADFVFHCIPAEIEPRYLVSLVPGLVILAYFGIAWPARAVSPRRAPIIVAVALIAVAAAEWTPYQKRSLAMAQASQTILGQPQRNPFVLVASSTGGEGALIAAMATQDRARREYVVRGFKVLAAGNWMGTDYHARFDEPAKMAEWIENAGIGWLVLDDLPASLRWKHNRDLRALVDAGRPGWSLVASLPTAEGRTEIYRIAAGFDGQIDRAPLLRELSPQTSFGLN